MPIDYFHIFKKNIEKKLVFPKERVIVFGRVIPRWNYAKIKENGIMKKLLIVAAAAVVALAFTGCGSLRTPTSGARAKNVYYNTFFGISVESLVYGDGLIVNQK